MSSLRGYCNVHPYTHFFNKNKLHKIIVAERSKNQEYPKNMMRLEMDQTKGILDQCQKMFLRYSILSLSMEVSPAIP